MASSISYTRDKGGRTVSWPKRIAAAQARGRFTKSDKYAAEDWVTCACGRQDTRLQRDEYGAPVDDRLRALGVGFTLAVEGDRIDEAESTLARIEKRAAQLLKRAK